MASEEHSPHGSDEISYRDYLAVERHMFAWCLMKLGGRSPPEANAAAERFYSYQAPSEPHRELVFHDEAWHWAMLELFGEEYWISRPGLESPSSDYRAEASRHFAAGKEKA